MMNDCANVFQIHHHGVVRLVPSQEQVVIGSAVGCAMQWVGACATRGALLEGQEHSSKTRTSSMCRWGGRPMMMLQQ